MARRSHQLVGMATLRSGVLVHQPRLISGLPFAVSRCSGYSHLQRQLFTGGGYLQRVALLDVASQELLGQLIVLTAGQTQLFLGLGRRSG